MLVYSCKSKPCNPEFFDRVDEFPQYRKVFHLDSVQNYNQSFCAYNFHFRFWDTLESRYQLRGVIFMSGQKIYCHIKERQAGYILLDFDEKSGVTTSIAPQTYAHGRIVSYPDEFSLKVDSKWFDEKYNDTIYKFRFMDMEIKEGYDVLMYIGKHVGWVGGYLGGFKLIPPGDNSDSIEYMTRFYGDIFLEKDTKYKREMKILNIM